MADLVPSLDSDEEVTRYDSDFDDAVAQPFAKSGAKARAKKPAATVVWDGLLDAAPAPAAAPAAAERSDDHVRALAAPKRKADGEPKAAKSGAAGRKSGEEKKPLSWSFKDALAKLDSQAAGTMAATSLTDKIAALRAAKGGAKGAAAGSKAKAMMDDEEEEEEEEEDDEQEGAAATSEDEDAADSDEEEADEDEEDSDDDDEEDEDDDEEDEAGSSDEEGEGSDDEEGEEEGSGSEGEVNVDDVVANAKPNPYRQRDAGDAELEAEYRRFFESDPFAGEGGGEHTGVRQLKPAGGAGLGPGGSAASGAAPDALREPASFSDMNLSRPLLKAVAALGFKEPTAIQRRTVPLALAGRDICGSAVTGSGKTAAYLLPILERLLYRPSHVAATRVIILTPTRELATQVQSMAQQLAQFCPAIRIALVVGGMALKTQEAELRARPDIIIATPGRLLDHIRNSLAVHCDDVDVLVLDEADRLLEMGFEDEVTEIVKACPLGRQTMLFSATMTARVETLAKLSLRKPVRVLADPLYDMAGRLSQEFIRIRPGAEGDREAILLSLLTRSLKGSGILVFASQKVTAHRVAIVLGMAGLAVSELHGNLTQRQRLQSLEDFRDGTADILVATDLAGRGLDIAGVRIVINYDMPRELAAYVHRVGRTARAGRAGVSVSLVLESQRAMMKEIVKRATLNVKARTVDPAVIAQWRERVEAWEPDIAAVYAMEREEKELRLADMEATRATNLMVHEDEIKARPARTWFQTETEKKAKRDAAAAAAKGVPAAAPAAPAADDKLAGKKRGREEEESKDKKPHRLTRAKRRRLESKAEDEREARRIAKAEAMAAREARAAGYGDDDDDGGSGDEQGRGKKGGGKKGGAKKPVMDPRIVQAKKRLERVNTATHTQYSTAKKAKAAVRAMMNNMGVSSAQARRMVKAQEGGGKKANKKKTGGGKPGAPKAGGGGGSSGGGKGGSSFSSEMRSAGGKGKGAGAGFKSKSRFKRRA